MQKHLISAVKYVFTHIFEGALQQVGAVAAIAFLAKLVDTFYQ